jgi:hypothetical protein
MAPVRLGGHVQLAVDDLEALAFLGQGLDVVDGEA